MQAKKDRYSIIDNIKAGINATLPLAILLLLLSWVMKLVFKLIQPIIVIMAPRAEDQTVFVKIAALILSLFIVFLIGAILRSEEGRRLFSKVEEKIFKILPGYTVVKEIILQFIGTKKTPFSQVALVRTFGSATEQIAFITDENENGSYTVFIPTGPNPTSGNIFILPKDQVRLVDTKVEQAMKAIVTGGIGTNAVIYKGRKKQ
jgi:uncharacterized membrane protein